MPNSFDVLVSGRKLAGSLQYAVIWCLLRHGALDDWVQISSSEIAMMCASERTVVQRSVADMVNRRIIAKRPAGKHERTTTSRYMLTPENWATAPAHAFRGKEFTMKKDVA